MAVLGLARVEQDVIYDTQSISSGQSSDLTFFAQAISGSTTYATTNMQKARELPGNEELGVKAFEAVIALATSPEDLAQVYNNGWVELNADRVNPFALALRFIPCGSAIYGIDNRTTGTTQVGTQWHAGGNLYGLEKSFRMPAGTNFDLKLRFGTAPALNSARNLTFGLHGIRASDANIQ